MTLILQPLNFPMPPYMHSLPYLIPALYPEVVEEDKPEEECSVYPHPEVYSSSK